MVPQNKNELLHTRPQTIGDPDYIAGTICRQINEIQLNLFTLFCHRSENSNSAAFIFCVEDYLVDCYIVILSVINVLKFLRKSINPLHVFVMLKTLLKKMSSENYDTLSGRRCNKCNKRKIIYIILIIVLILALIAFLTAFVVIPVAFMLSFSFQDSLMFTRFGLRSDTSAFNLTHVPGLENIYVDVNDVETNGSITLGTWHLLPWGLVSESITNSDFSYEEALKNSSYNVLIYFHGTGETRRDSYTLYTILRIFFHVIAFDYRGYGDSSRGHMSENAVVNDCVQFVEWVRSKTDSQVFIWGESLGTSLATSAIARLKQKGFVPAGVALVAPFTTMRDEIPVHPYGRIFAWLPWFKATMLDPLYNNGFRFENTKHILNVDSPIMVLSAEDDSVVPYTLGKKLVTTARLHRNETQGNITFYQIPAQYGCDHFWIYLDPDLPYKIWRFLIGLNTTEDMPRFTTEALWQITPPWEI